MPQTRAGGSAAEVWPVENPQPGSVGLATDDLSSRPCLFDATCARAGFQPRITLEAGNLGILARLASLGLGMAILPESVASANAEGSHAIEITHPRMRGRVALAWRSEGPIGPAAQALIRRARTVGAPVPARSAAIPEA